MWELLFLLLPLAALSGWFIGRRKIVNLPNFFNKKKENNAELFIQWLKSNQETLETHFTLGSLFRRRGEVDKAISIHQNLITDPNLNEEQKALSLLELSRDYMRAGVLDRAENSLLELVQRGYELEASFQHLLDIYQLSKDWLHAIEVAEKLQQQTNCNLSNQISHFYCELALQHWIKGDRTGSLQYLDKAMKTNSKSVRASLLLGDIEANTGNYKEAIKAYHRVEEQDKDFLSEVIFRLTRCYEAIGNPDQMAEFLTSSMTKQPAVSVILAFSKWLNKTQGLDAAIQFMEEHLRTNPSIQGIDQLIGYSLINAEEKTKIVLQLIQELIQKLVTNKPLYRCQACGFSGRILQWQCPGCKRWDVIKPIQE